jgi:hypothetical protein
MATLKLVKSNAFEVVETGERAGTPYVNSWPFARKGEVDTLLSSRYRLSKIQIDVLWATGAEIPLQVGQALGPRR